MAVVSSVVGFWGTEQGWKGLWQNLGPELAGAVLTFVLIDLVLGTRQRKVTLIAQMGSDVRDVAVRAVEELRQEGWLTDGSLEGADLSKANLEGAQLAEARLRGASLIAARLERAKLKQAHLEDARLMAAHLEDAELVGARLDSAMLWFAHLNRAVLVHASLEGAALWGADLRSAFVTADQLAQACSLRETILRDGTKLSEDNWEAEFEEWQRKQKKRGAVEQNDDDD
jgi:uncharacterized protein YjbI with pentapeptide repeats